MSEVPSHAVIVGGHAVFTGGPTGAIDDDRSWSLQSFQRGEPSFYVEHIRAGVELAAGDAAGLLVLSGGATRVDAGPVTEAAGYRDVAARLNWWSHDRVAARTALEENARDSFENLLFGICRFHECTRAYPTHVTVVSWAFKARRFDAHRDAIGFPRARFRFVGVNQPADREGAERGEARVRAEYATDPYGAGVVLAGKRAARNPFARSHRYAETCPELRALLAHAGPERFAQPLPWTT
jgi:hypothetical protein